MKPTPGVVDHGIRFRRNRLRLTNALGVADLPWPLPKRCAEPHFKCRHHRHCDGWKLGDGKATLAVAAFGLLCLIIYINTNKRRELIQAAICVGLLTSAIVAEQLYVPNHHPIPGFGQSVDFGVWVCVGGFIVAIFGVRQLFNEDKARRRVPSVTQTNPGA